MITRVIEFINQSRKFKVTFKIPQLLLMNNVQLSRQHLEEVLKENEIERQWYRDVLPFESYASILKAAADGGLEKVKPTADYLPILRLRNPALGETYPAYLTKEAKAVLDEIGRTWRQRADAERIDRKVRLAITSLARTQPYQQLIVKAGKLADPESVHTRGEAFDIDASGYYLDNVPINPRQDREKEFAAAFKELGAELDSPHFGDFHLYNPKVHDILHEVMNQLQKEGKLHFVHEYPNTNNAVFHACRNPRYQP